MPLTNYGCPDCGGLLHTDDLLSRRCVTPGCGAELPDKSELPDYDPDEAGSGDDVVELDGDF